MQSLCPPDEPGRVWNEAMTIIPVQGPHHMEGVSPHCVQKIIDLMYCIVDTPCGPAPCEMDTDQPQCDKRKSMLVFNNVLIHTSPTAHGSQHAQPEVATIQAVAGPTEGAVSLGKSVNNPAPCESWCHMMTLPIV